MSHKWQQSYPPCKDDGPHEGNSTANGSGINTRSSSKRFKMSVIKDQPGHDQEESLDSKIVHHNPPVLMTVYRDPETENEKVVIIAALIGGSTDVEFSLVGSGPKTTIARITYSWPKLAYDMDALFAKEIQSGSLASYHPKILALKKCLESKRNSPDETPKGVMELSLPIPVQTDVNSISCTGRKSVDGSMILMVELMAHVVKQEDTKVSVVFEDV